MEPTLTYKDFEKLKRLRLTFDRNYRLTHLLANYLNLAPTLITREMVDELTADGALTREEAIGAILTEVFLPNAADDPEERILSRDYLLPAVRILDAARYENDPYYKAIDIKDATRGRFALKNESYAPYRAVVGAEVEVMEDGREIVPIGYFPDGFDFLAIAEDGNEWMTLTPIDLDTSREAIDAAHGRVITFGLGLGYYVFMAAAKEEVEEIVAVEKSSDVIALFREHILPHIPNAHKVRIIEADAFLYAEEEMTREHYDVAFVDTWRDVSDGLPMYLRMKKAEGKHPGTRFLYWIEDFILSHLRSLVFEEIWAHESADATHRGEGATRTFDEILYRLSKEGLRKEALMRTKDMFKS